MYDTYSPTLICESQLDRFTVEDTEIGNGYLTYPIALLTVDEVSMAGAVYYGVSGLWDETSGNLKNSSNVPDILGVRPVINISSSVLVASGTGTASDPYTLTLE